MWILVVDDERRLADGIRRGLQAEGFAVDVAHDGVDGLWWARENRYDAILLDLMLPGMSGWAVCRTLREEGIWTPVLILTAKDGDWDEVEALEAGADDRAGGENPRGGAAAHRIGDLVVDPGPRRASRGGEEIELTSREFAVLEFLARNAGRVVSKREVVANVWDDDFDGDPSIVEVYVAHLRRKLDRPYGTATIETVRGAGYRLGGSDG
jgi:two-component system OmpR family response regulator